MAFALPVWFLAQQEMLAHGDEASGIFDDFDDDALFDFFHLNRACVTFIADKLRDRIDPEAADALGLTADVMVMVALNYYAHGVSSSSVLQKARLSHADNPSVISAVSAALADMSEQFVSFPSSTESRENLALRTERLCGIPGVLGVLAPVHFKIRASPYEKDVFRSYVNSFGFTSVVSQVICDYDANIMSMEKCSGGSAFEQDLWESSLKGKEFEEEGVHGSYWVVGGSGYFQSKHVLTPVSEPKTKKEVDFNTDHSRIYSVMQATLGVMKRRFRVLLQLGFVHDGSLEKKFNIIKACVVLHNITKKFSVPPPAAGKQEPLQTGKLPSRWVGIDQEGLDARQKLIDSRSSGQTNSNMEP